MADRIGGIASSARGVRRITAICHWADKSKLELAFLALILVTVLAVRFEDQILRRTITIGPDTKLAFSHAHSDATAGGNSSARADLARPYGWTCELRDAYAYPYCAYEWVFGEGGRSAGFDLTRFDRLTLSLTYEGQAKSLRLYLKNFDARYSKPGIANPHKFNVAEIPLASSKRTIQLETGDFSVAEWWILEHQIPPALSHPQFDNVVALEVSSGTGAPLGSHRFEVHQITFHGRLLSTQEWYLALSVGWLALMSLFLTRLRREVRGREDAEERAERHARHDPVTGFFNRRTLGSQVDRELGFLLGRGESGALLLVEIEHPTSVGHLYGEAAGEALLVEIARRVRDVLGSEALVGRVRDDEVACLVTGDADQVRDQATELLQQLNAPIHRNGGSINVAATLGIACFPHHGSTYAKLVAAAEVALREGQRSGARSYGFFDPEQPRAVPNGSGQAPAESDPNFLRAAAMEVLIKESRRIVTTWLGGSPVVVELSADQLRDEWAAERLITIVTSEGEASDLVVKVKESCFTCATAIRHLETLQRAGIKIILADFQNLSAAKCNSIMFDHVELNEAYFNSRLAAARSLHRTSTPLTGPASVSVTSKAA